MSLIFCFDIDGTLLSTNGAGTRSFKSATWHLFNKKIDWSNISMAGRVDPGIFKDILKLIDYEYSDDIWDKFKSLYIENLKKEIKNSEVTVFDGVYEFLKSIENEDKILVTGNIKEGAKIKLGFKKLSDYFYWDRSVFGDDALYYRDELADVLLKRNKSKIPVIIGDTPLDISLAKKTGGISVAVTTGIYTAEELKKYNPDFILDNIFLLNIDLLYKRLSVMI
ncbi:MAG TPA: HAD hydrolase-like protein [Spirochaetota bacterium]|nr:HAD hydrolase-like protein [Spirochaetota bacterium]HOM38747.1 HAD hydrolase-like protein [Spirochaetota bacterium]HPQ49545.1 HAD hydrolase-like protein [Spirochaetota bacterium]